MSDTLKKTRETVDALQAKLRARRELDKDIVLVVADRKRFKRRVEDLEEENERLKSWSLLDAIHIEVSGPGDFSVMAAEIRRRIGVETVTP